ncbi:hypothetical protein D3C72_1874820 [compost metagenome]
MMNAMSGPNQSETTPPINAPRMSTQPFINCSRPLILSSAEESASKGIDDLRTGL